METVLTATASATRGSILRDASNADPSGRQTINGDPAKRRVMAAPAGALALALALALSFAGALVLALGPAPALSLADCCCYCRQIECVADCAQGR